ncbi:hypothetical protein PAPYR_6992 [Paratrimastix pyriformis]|uniref:Uncharacterized protein n=1 Tax=Paratrimastix pyriformis TaxID=342808 RepID=A0ABQ8UL63_9EUKA|nr:hypothetical protein PAPYR_6992 [Paratrimastix pyriformis]
MLRNRRQLTTFGNTIVGVNVVPLFCGEGLKIVPPDLLTLILAPLQELEVLVLENLRLFIKERYAFDSVAWLQKTFGNLRNVRRLGLRRTDAISPVFQNGLQRAKIFPNLECLQCDFPMEFWLLAMRFPLLVSLTLAPDRTSFDDMPTSCLPNLRELAMQQFRWDSPISPTAELGRWARALHHLELVGFSDGVAEALAEAHSLGALHISGVHCTDTVLATFLLQRRNLRSLSIHTAGKAVGSATLRAIAAHPTIADLNLAQCEGFRICDLVEVLKSLAPRLVRFLAPHPMSVTTLPDIRLVAPLLEDLDLSGWWAERVDLTLPRAGSVHLDGIRATSLRLQADQLSEIWGLGTAQVDFIELQCPRLAALRLMPDGSTTKKAALRGLSTAVDMPDLKCLALPLLPDDQTLSLLAGCPALREIYALTLGRTHSLATLLRLLPATLTSLELTLICPLPSGGDDDGAARLALPKRLTNFYLRFIKDLPEDEGGAPVTLVVEAPQLAQFFMRRGPVTRLVLRSQALANLRLDKCACLQDVALPGPLVELQCAGCRPDCIGPLLAQAAGPTLAVVRLGGWAPPGALLDPAEGAAWCRLPPGLDGLHTLELTRFGWPRLCLGPTRDAPARAYPALTSLRVLNSTGPHTVDLRGCPALDTMAFESCPALTEFLVPPGGLPSLTSARFVSCPELSNAVKMTLGYQPLMPPDKCTVCFARRPAPDQRFGAILAAELDG